MERYKIYKLLNGSTISKFVTKKMIYQVVNVLLTTLRKRLKTSVLRSDLCDYSDAYIVVKGTIDLLTATANENDKA